MKPENENGFLKRISIRYMIFVYFTVTALAASIFIGLSLYSRMSKQMSDTMQEENQILIDQVNRSVDVWLRGIMKLSDSLYYDVIKNADLENELCGIVDLGGKVINVMVNHRIYGHIEAELNISSRRQVENFMEDIRSGKSSPLKNITSDYHYHKVEAESEEILDMIQDMLKRRGFLIEAE